MYALGDALRAGVWDARRVNTDAARPGDRNVSPPRRLVRSALAVDGASARGHEEIGVGVGEPTVRRDDAGQVAHAQLPEVILVEPPPRGHLLPRRLVLGLVRLLLFLVGSGGSGWDGAVSGGGGGGGGRMRMG